MKKSWAKPDFYIIDRDPVQAKNNNAIHEGTGHYVTLTSFGYKAFLNGANTRAFVISNGGNPVANKTDLVS